MSESSDRQISNMTGAAAVPRSNGELVFEAPWEGRAFGVAVALNEDGAYEWREFRDRLVEEISAAERSGSSSSYYERWLASLETLVLEKGLIGERALELRVHEYASGQREDHD
jgi:nitrile hydratase accessory protein